MARRSAQSVKDFISFLSFPVFAKFNIAIKGVLSCFCTGEKIKSSILMVHRKLTLISQRLHRLVFFNQVYITEISQGLHRNLVLISQDLLFKFFSVLFFAMCYITIEWH